MEMKQWVGMEWIKVPPTSLQKILVSPNFCFKCLQDIKAHQRAIQPQELIIIHFGDSVFYTDRGLKFVSKDREDRLTAIGRYLADTSRGYDIVGLQEVWVYDDFLRIKDLVRDTLPYAKHWYSGALGSGLVILSKYPVIGSTMRRFALNGDPMKIFHGDWYVGKCVVSAIIAHPTCGEIEVFNTHVSVFC